MTQERKRYRPTSHVCTSRGGLHCASDWIFEVLAIELFSCVRILRMLHNVIHVA